MTHTPHLITSSAANEDAVNHILYRQGYGPDNLHIPLVSDSVKDVVLDTDPVVSEYVCVLPMTEADKRVVDNLLKSQGLVDVLDTSLDEYKTSRLVKRETERFDVGCAILIVAANRDAIITRLESRYPNANTKFFTTALSQTGAAPAQAYIDKWKIDASFKNELIFFADAAPKSEIFLWGVRNGVKEKMESIFADTKYKSTDRNNRTTARVTVINSPAVLATIITNFGLKVIP